jgi:hypothetical protein
MYPFLLQKFVNKWCTPFLYGGTQFHLFGIFLGCKNLANQNVSVNPPQSERFLPFRSIVCVRKKAGLDTQKASGHERSFFSLFSFLFFLSSFFSWCLFLLVLSRVVVCLVLWLSCLVLWLSCLVFVLYFIC